MKKSVRRVLVILFVVIVAICMYISDRGIYLEYKELGENYLPIFKTNLLYKYAIMAINFVLIYVIMYIENKGIKNGLKVFFDQEKKEQPHFLNKSISLVVAAISSFVVGFIFTPKVILFASNVSFGRTDLIFNLDISFYMFAEPLIKMLLRYFMIIYIALIFYSVLYYIFIFNRYFDGIDRETLKKSNLIKHLIKYIKSLAIIFAVFNLVGTLDIVFSNFVTTDGGLELIGAGKTDVIIKLWGNVILSIVIIITAFLVSSNLKKFERSKIIRDIIIIPAYLVSMFVVMICFDLLYVKTNEYDKQKKYIERNISYTKEAYGIDCDTETIDYSGTITTDQINNNQNILDNAVIINKEMALNKLNEEQTEKGYYKYNTLGLIKSQDKNNNTRLIYLSPREIVSSKRTYNGKTFEYTHGYGAIGISATSTTNDGDIAYIEDNDYIKTKQIYYGLETNNAIVIDENSKNEYDYTDSKGNEYTSTYNGNSGLKLGFLDRFNLGVKINNVKLAFSSDISKDNRILINRNIIRRAELVLPDVLFDENPYVVADKNGDMYWVLDGYTVSNNYPYSTRASIKYSGEKRTINYIRNSIKVIINCYDGNMRFYITDSTDPIAMAYRKMYPDVFQGLDSQIPEDISSQFVYPQFLYDIQSSMLEEYHNTKSEILYRGDDSWSTATYVTNQNGKSVTTKLESYYTMVKNNNLEEIGLIQMYTPSEKQNLTSYLVGVVENGTNKLKISKLSSDQSILGLTQLDSKILENDGMNQEIQSLNVTGARVTKQIMVVPIDNTILYIEQIYQTKINESGMPYLKKVIVASGNKIAIGNNLKEALENIVSQEATSIDTYTDEDIDGLIQSIIKANKNLTQSMNANDWELMGTDVKTLQELINELEKQENEEKKKEKNTTNTTNTENATDENNSNVEEDNTNNITNN